MRWELDREEQMFYTYNVLRKTVPAATTILGAKHELSDINASTWPFCLA